MSDRVAVFHRGALQQVASPRQLYDEPVNSFVAGFVGENNLLPCSVDDAGGAVCANGARLGGTMPIKLSSGSPGLLAIRPERVELAPPGTNGMFSGTVTDAFFLGDHVRLEVRLADEQSITVKLPAGADAPAAGDQVGLVLPPAHCQILARPPAVT